MCLRDLVPRNKKLMTKSYQLQNKSYYGKWYGKSIGYLQTAQINYFLLLTYILKNQS